MHGRGTHQREQSNVDQVDVGDAKRQLAGEHDSLVQDVIDHIEQRDVDLIESHRHRRLEGPRSFSPSMASHQTLTIR